MIINSRRDITFFIQAVNCNPNGDPDMDNLPRVDSDTGIGFMTDAAIKARIRAYIEAAFQNVDGMEIFFKDKASLNRQIAEAVFEAVGKVKRLKVILSHWKQRNTSVRSIGM